jgi:undecaprenyl-diphosphatase
VDRAILLWLNGMRPSALDGVLGFLGNWGMYAFPLAMLLALRGGKAQARNVRDGWLTFLLSSTISELVIKPLIARPRPTADNEVKHLLHVLGTAPPASSFAFPSGTAVACYAASTFIWACWGRGPGITAMFLATVISFSRVYAGIHWPSDVAAGGVLGAAMAIAFWRFYRWAEPK